MISIRDGFLEVKRKDGKICQIKGSVISMVTDLGDGIEGSQITVGNEGWAIDVVDAREQIVTAIGESYKRVNAR